jgi:hypothetical protein
MNEMNLFGRTISGVVPKKHGVNAWPVICCGHGGLLEHATKFGFHTSKSYLTIYASVGVSLAILYYKVSYIRQ